MAPPQNQPIEVVQWASKTQEDFFRRGPAPTLAAGGYGSGKTRAALLKLLYVMDRFPNYRVVVVRRRYKELWKTTIPTLFKLLPPYYQASSNKQSGELILKNGSRFDFLHLESADSSTVLRGLEINGALIDQAEEADSETFDLLMTRINRWDQVKIDPAIIERYQSGGKAWMWQNEAGTKLPPPYVLLTANPDTELHWLWKRFHPDSQEWRDKYRERGYLMYTFDSRDNKFLSKQNIEEMMSKGDQFVRQYVMGIWGRPEGTLFDVNPDSIVEPTPDIVEKVTKTMALYRSLDHGYSAPTCCLWSAVDRDGNIIIFREYYNISDQMRVHRKNITGLSQGETYRGNYADPEIFQMKPMAQGGRYSVHGEYTDVKLYPADTAIWWGRADNNEMASRLRMKEYLWVDPKHKNPFTGKMGAPRLYFLMKTDDYPNGCSNIIDQMKTAKLTKVGTVDGRAIFNDERDPTVPDHALDCLSGDTLVDTPSGQVRIDQLPESGIVCTPVGPIAYLDAKRYHSNRPVVKVEFQNGGSITCTPDHRLLTKTGWVQASDALHSECLTLSQSQLSAKTSWVSATISAAFTFSEKVSAYTERFGKLITDLCLPNTTSITRMRTGLTTSTPILSAGPSSVTCPTTLRLTQPEQSSGKLPESKLLPLGMPLPQEELGTDKPLSTPGLWLERQTAQLTKSANSAASLIVRLYRALVGLNSATSIARWPRFEPVTRITNAGTTDVYCLTVDHPIHGFSVNGGVVVSNCARYMVMSRPMPNSEVEKSSSIRTFSGYSKIASSERRKREALGRINR